MEALDELLRAEVQLIKARLGSAAAPGSPSPATQDDVAQEAVLRLLAAAPPPRFATSAALRGYLWTSARNLLIDRLRRRKLAFQPLEPSGADSLTMAPETRGSVDRVDRDDQAAALELALNLLSQADREILHAVYFLGLSIEDAAVRLGVTRPVANSRLVRARLRLGDRLSDWSELIQS